MSSQHDPHGATPTSPGTLDARLTHRLETLARDGLTRRLPAVSHRAGVRYALDDRPVIGFCSNDYLGLADHPTLAGPFPGSPGATASRLISGDLPSHRLLEQRLAELADTDDAVLFPSGFQANVGVLPALLDATDAVYSDALNHASLIDGLRLARAPIQILPHHQPPPATPTATGLAWWITESVFSMDGDAAPAPDLATHLERGGCVYLDEAHSFGLYRGGTGWAQAHGLHPTVTLATLGKAFGCAGAFVASSSVVCNWIRTRARSFVFTTGSSPALLRPITAALDLVTGSEGQAARARLGANLHRLSRHLDGDPHPFSPIFPLVIGDNALTVIIANELLELGWHVQPIRPPTVPVGTARLRITLSAAHDPDDIDRFADDLLRVFAKHGLRPRIQRGHTRPSPGPPATTALP